MDLGRLCHLPYFSGAVRTFILGGRRGVSGKVPKVPIIPGPFVRICRPPRGFGGKNGLRKGIWKEFRLVSNPRGSGSQGGFNFSQREGSLTGAKRDLGGPGARPEGPGGKVWVGKEGDWPFRGGFWGVFRGQPQNFPKKRNGLERFRAVPKFPPIFGCWWGFAWCGKVSRERFQGPKSGGD